MLQLQWRAPIRRWARVRASDSSGHFSVSAHVRARADFGTIVYTLTAAGQAAHALAFASQIAGGDPITKTSAVDRVEVVRRSSQGSVKSVFVWVEL